jgi:Flp pilus assembly protein TadD
LWIWALAAAPVVLLARVAQPTPETYAAPMWGRGVVMMDALAAYLGKLVWPARLAIDYGRSPEWVLGSMAKYWTWVAPVAIGCALWAMRKKRPFLPAGGMVFVAMLLPMLGLVKFDFQRHSTVADHYLYMAMLGPAMVAAFAVKGAKNKWIYGAAGALIAALAVRAFVQTGVWRDSQSLFAHALEVNPTSLAGNDGLGNMALHGGDVKGAIARFEAAVRGHPHDPIANFNLANALLIAGRYREAAEAYRWSLEGRTFPFLYVNYANALVRSGQVNEAERMAEKGRDRWPANAELHATLGALKEARGDRKGAEEEYAAALRTAPGMQEAQAGLDRLRNATTRPVER